MRHMGGGGSGGSSLVRAMVTMSSSSLESSLDETSVTHSCFSTKKLLLVCPFFFGKSWSSCHGSSSSQVSCFCSSFLLLHHRLNHGDACSCYPCFFCPAWGNLDGCDLFLHNCSKFCSSHPLAGTFPF